MHHENHRQVTRVGALTHACLRALRRTQGEGVYLPQVIALFCAAGRARDLQTAVFRGLPYKEPVGVEGLIIRWEVPGALLTVLGADGQDETLNLSDAAVDAIIRRHRSPAPVPLEEAA